MKAGARLVLGKDDEGRRLDRVLRIALVGMTLSAIHKALRKGDIRVDGARREPESRCAAGEVVEISGVLLSPSENRSMDRQGRRGAGSQQGREPAPLPSPAFPILLETPDLLIINKPMGLLVHGGPGSLEARVRDYLAPNLAPSLSFRPGPLHRLDRNTSGIIAFSKSIDGARAFSEALRERLLVKTYVAILEGRLDKGVVWEDLLVRDSGDRRSRVAPAAANSRATTSASHGGTAHGAKVALTKVAPLAFSDSFTLAAITLGTGRTHQIRAQAAARGHPLAGDRKYGASPCERPYYLHAWRLSVPNAMITGLPPTLEAPIPGYFMEKIDKLFPMSEIEVYFKP